MVYLIVCSERACELPWDPETIFLGSFTKPFSAMQGAIEVAEEFKRHGLMYDVAILEDPGCGATETIWTPAFEFLLAESEYPYDDVVTDLAYGVKKGGKDGNFEVDNYNDNNLILYNPDMFHGDYTQENFRRTEIYNTGGAGNY